MMDVEELAKRLYEAYRECALREGSVSPVPSWLTLCNTKHIPENQCELNCWIAVAQHAITLKLGMQPAEPRPVELDEILEAALLRTSTCVEEARRRSGMVHDSDLADILMTLIQGLDDLHTVVSGLTKPK